MGYDILTTRFFLGPKVSEFANYRPPNCGGRCHVMSRSTQLCLGCSRWRCCSVQNKVSRTEGNTAFVFPDLVIVRGLWKRGASASGRRGACARTIKRPTSTAYSPSISRRVLAGKGNNCSNKHRLFPFYIQIGCLLRHQNPLKLRFIIEFL